MKRKILSVVILCLFESVIVSCIYGTCDPVPPHFEIKGITSYNLRYTNSGKSNPWETIEENESIVWTNFFTRFGFEVNYIASKHLNFGGALVALSCEEAGGAGDKIGVDTVIVRTLFDYNENYPTGSVINDIVLINRWTFFYDGFDKFLPLEDYLIENSEGVRYDTFELKLTEAPSTSRTFSFDVTYKLNNGEEFQHKTTPVNLMK